MKKQWITGITILTMTAVLTACGGTGNSSTGNAGPSDKSSSLESILQDEYNSDTDSPEESQTDIESALSDSGLEETSASYASDTEPAAEKASSLETTVEDPSSPETDSSQTDGIRPEFKEAMDSYEAFFDEYVDFMEKYEDSDDVLGMLDEYSDYLTKYADYMEKLDDVDTNNLSAADAAYYAEVSARITKKLAGIGQ